MSNKTPENDKLELMQLIETLKQNQAMPEKSSQLTNQQAKQLAQKIKTLLNQSLN